MRDIEITLVPPAPSQAFGIYSSSRDCGRVGDFGATRFIFKRPVQYIGSIINLIFGAGYSGIAPVQLGQLNTYILEPPITDYAQFDLQLEVTGDCTQKNSGVLLDSGNRASSGLLWSLTPKVSGASVKLTFDFGVAFTGMITLYDPKRNQVFTEELEDSSTFEYSDDLENLNLAMLSESKLEIVPVSSKKQSLIFDMSSIQVERSNKLKFYLTPTFPQYPNSDPCRNPLSHEMTVKNLMRTSLSVNRKSPELLVEPDGTSSIRFYNYNGDPISSIDLEDYVKFDDLDKVVIQKRFVTMTDAEQYVKENDCIGYVFSIHNGSEWLLYIVNDQNQLVPATSGALPSGDRLILNGGTSGGY